MLAFKLVKCTSCNYPFSDLLTLDAIFQFLTLYYFYCYATFVYYCLAFYYLDGCISVKLDVFSWSVQKVQHSINQFVLSNTLNN